MSEILTLAETFKKKSSEQAESIERQLDSVMTKLNDSMTARLSESENITKNGMGSLSEQNEQLQQMLRRHEQDTRTALTTYTKQVQAHLTQGLSEHADAVQTMIESYAESTHQSIKNKESQIASVIKSDLGKWATVAGIALLVIFILGAFFGAWIASKAIEPATYKYYHDSKSGQTYMFPIKAK